MARFLAFFTLCHFFRPEVPFNIFSIKKSYFWFPRLSGVTMATSLSGGT